MNFMIECRLYEQIASKFRILYIQYILNIEICDHEIKVDKPNHTFFSNNLWNILYVLKVKYIPLK